MAYTNIVEAQHLARHLDDRDWRVVDCRFSMAEPDAGERDWRQGHIAGAAYAHLDRDMAAPVTPGSGRHPLPEVNALAARIAAWGIGERSQVVLYDEASGALAARLWWLMRWLGHESVAVLNGGLRAWQAGGLPLSRDESLPAPGGFTARPAPDVMVSSHELSALLASGKGLLLDARDAERFMGNREPLDIKAGHIPGARNYPFSANLAPDGRLLAAEKLRACFDAAIEGYPATSVMVMCGSGVTACHNLLAMDVAGLKGARLYPGSWSEWVADPDRPVATGSE